MPVGAVVGWDVSFDGNPECARLGCIVGFIDEGTAVGLDEGTEVGFSDEGGVLGVKEGPSEYKLGSDDGAALAFEGWFEGCVE